MSTNSNEATHARKPTSFALVWLAVLLIFGVVIAQNFVSIKSFWGMGAEAFRLRSAVQAEFDVQDVSINLNREVPGKRLKVKLANPPFADLSGPELEAKVKEVATLAYREFGAKRGFQKITVVVSNKSGTVITIAEDQEFHFTAEELSAENEASKDAAPNGAANG